MELDAAVLAERISESKTPQDFVDMSMEIFGNPMLITDSNMMVVAVTDVQTGDPLFDELKDTQRRTPLPTMKESWQEDMRKMLEADKPELSTVNGVTMLTRVLRFNGRYVGQLCLSAYFRPITAHDRSLVELISYPLTLILFSRQLTPHMKYSDEEYMLEYLLDGNELSQEDVAAKLRIFNWRPSECYYVLCRALELESTEIDDVALRSIIGSNDRLLRYRGYFVAILSRKAGFDGLDALEIALQRLGAVCGLSCGFDDLSQVKAYFEQAKAALEIGVRVDGARSLYPFGEYLDYSLIHYFEPKSALTDFVMPRLMDLVEADGEESKLMLNTLRQYLYSGRSVRKTAEKLFIHRNTVAYRVGKATQRLNISLDDGRAFRRLSISLQILEYLDRDRYFGSADES